METQRKPEFTAKFGSSIRLTIWANPTKSGEQMLTATITRRYRSRDGVWKDSSSFAIGELDSVLEAVEMARRWLAENGAAPSNGKRSATLEEDAPW